MENSTVESIIATTMTRYPIFKNILASASESSFETSMTPTEAPWQRDSGDTEPQHYESLLDSLTLEEKISLLSGASLTSTTGIDRLNIPPLKISDSINGVRGSQSHLEDKGTAVFPSSTCLASTWNRSLMHDFGTEVGIQAKLKTVQIVSGPNINLHRDPRGGRNFETFSEDPLLTGQLAASIVNGIQSTGVGTCAKHFVCYESETLRRKYNVAISPTSRTIRELYMKAFQYLLREANPVSIMMAYNKVDGDYCSQSSLIQNVLRHAWKYDGCVMSDWYGTHACAEALIAGLDLEMPGPSVFRGQRLLEEVITGHVEESYVVSAARSVLRMIDRVAKHYSNAPEQSVISERTGNIACCVAAEGMVLLKNNQNTLPLDERTAPSIALIGPGAATPVVSGGGSACAHPQYMMSMIDTFKAHQSLGHVGYAQGVTSDVCVPTIPATQLEASNGVPGIDVEYYNDGVVEAVYKETLSAAQIVMLGRLRPGLHDSSFHFVITTTLKVNDPGMYVLGAQVTGAFKLQIDGSEVLTGQEPDISVEDFLFKPKKLERTTEVYLDANRPYHLRLYVHSRQQSKDGEPTPHSATLVLQKSSDNRGSIAEAVTLASQSDISIIVAGRTHELESEGFDLEQLIISEAQTRLIRAVAAVSKRTILVLHHGNPIDISPVIDEVDAIIAAHFPGQDGARALADIVFGRTNPSGRLATTWPLKLDAYCVPSFDNFPCTMTSGQPEIHYAEGLHLGYRSSVARTASRFPFGHGLSYSTFTASQLQISALPDQQSVSSNQRELTAQVLVHNKGPFPGQHVVQLYLQQPSSICTAETDSKNSTTSPWRPYRELVAFTKVQLANAESRVVEMKFLERDITSSWDEEIMSWRPRSGTYTFVIADNAIAQASCHVDLDIKQEDVAWNGL